MKLVLVLIAAMVIPASGQTSGNVEVFTSQNIQAQLRTCWRSPRLVPKAPPTLSSGNTKRIF